MTVGRSYRTPGKHRLLNQMVGAYAGVFCKGLPSMFDDPFVMVDLCAGDAATGADSSPSILNKHATHIRASGRRAHVLLIEQAANTYTKLITAAEGWDVECVHADSREPGVVPTLWSPRSPVFLNNDPNNVAGFALSDDLMSRIPRFTTTLTTLWMQRRRPQTIEPLGSPALVRARRPGHGPTPQTQQQSGRDAGQAAR